MPHCIPRFVPVLLLGVVLPFFGCKKSPQPASSATEQTSMWPADMQELGTLNVSPAETAELAKARNAGLSDRGSITLIKLARSRHKPFAGGQNVATLLSSGVSEKTVLELARLNQLSMWTGQAQALHLAGFSDKVLLAVARRRAKGLPVLSGAKLAELRNAGASENQIIGMIERGYTEKQASLYIAERRNAAGGHRFVYQGHRRR